MEYSYIVNVIMEFIIEDLRNVMEDHGKSMGISSDMLRIQRDTHTHIYVHIYMYIYIYYIWMVGREALL
jgi:hypothetical protein